MDQQTCPYLGTLDSQQNQKPGPSYPSFENHCFADPTSADGTLLLGDQATYCLFGGCSHCPRFQDAQRYARPASSLFPSGFSPLPTLTYPKVPGPETIDFGILDSEPLDPDLLAVDVARTDHAFDLIDFAVDSGAHHSAPDLGTSRASELGMGESGGDDGWDDDDEFDDDRRFSPIWLIAATLFLGTFLCGGVMAAFLSFQVVRSNLFAASPSAGVVDVVDPVQGNAGTEQLLTLQEDANSSTLYIVLTATPIGQSAMVEEVPNVVEVVSDPDEQAVVDGVIALDVAEQPAEPESDDSVGDESNEAGELAIIAPTATINFPKAVTPTPIVVVLDNLDGNGAAGDSAQIVSANDISAPGESDSESPRFIPAPTSTPVPEINVQIPVPTPSDSVPVPEQAQDELIETVNEIASQQPAGQSEPEAEAVEAKEEEVVEEDTPTPEPTPTVTATWPPPLVLFGAKDKELMAGGCTDITWTVENVRAIYVENIAMSGSGKREECIKDKDEVFVMTVVLPDGGTKIYTTTVKLLLPTATPTATATFTPVPIPTATWTPIPPPPTPTPAFIYGVTLSAAGNALECTAGASCELELTATNIGNTTDNLVVYVERGGEWLPSLCRTDGACSVDRLVIAGIGAGNVVQLSLKFDIPAASAPRLESYIFRASTELSGGEARSESITIDVNVK